MLTEEYDDEDGRRVWLSREEIEMLLDVVDDPVRQVAFRLGAESGLRSHEIVQVTPRHVVDGGVAGRMLKVPQGKGDKYRETVIPSSLADLIEALGHDVPEEPVVNRSTRTLRDWIQKARRELVDEDPRWSFVTTHDLRRSWAGALANADVDETVALRLGGWNDLQTFLEHYRGDASPTAIRRERDKVDWP